VKFWSKFVAILVLLAASPGLMAEPPWFLVVHAPGPAWNATVEYSQQDGIDAHKQYLSTLAEQGSLAMAGGFSDQPGGLMLLKGVSMETAAEIVYGDPMVQSGVLTVELRAWQPELTTLTAARKRKPVPNIPKGATFKIGSPSPTAPINLEKN
jgi:uncharacterized protein YciI